MTVKQKQCLLTYFGLLEPSGIDGLWGPQSISATKNLQSQLGLEADGIWGNATDHAVKEAISQGEQLQDTPKDTAQTGTFWDHIRYWTREEFRCRCGEYHKPYCNGYPVEPDEILVELLDDIRGHFGRPAHRSSGIRCQKHNADSNGVYNSKHMTGKAMDFFIEGVSGETVSAYAASDPRCSYTYVIQGDYVHVDVA